MEFYLPTFSVCQMVVGMSGLYQFNMLDRQIDHAQYDWKAGVDYDSMNA